jgi:AcrR family transcriptional regulator
MARDESVRRKILDAAITEINEMGVSGLRIQTVCDQAGVTAPIIYRHFASREGLIEEAQVERYVGTFRDDATRFRGAVAECTSREELRRLAETSIRHNLAERRSARWTRLNVLGSSYARPGLQTRLNAEAAAVIDVLASAFREAQSRGLMGFVGDPRPLAAWVHSLFFARVFIENGLEDDGAPGWDRLTEAAILGAMFDPPG